METDKPAAPPLILQSNDDGWDARGLGLLRQELLRFAEVVICAPRCNQSAASHALTLSRVLRLRRPAPGIFTLDGKPADCIYVALHAGERVLPRLPALVVAGMNAGANLGTDVMYSGTVAAAREAAQRGIPAMAVSASPRADQAAAAAFGAQVIRRLLARLRPAPARTPLLNLNIPAGRSWQLRATRLGRRRYHDDVIFRQDPRGREYLWIGGAEVRFEACAGSDTDAWEAGIASLTPLSLDYYGHQHEELVSDIVAAVPGGGPPES